MKLHFQNMNSVATLLNSCLVAGMLLGVFAPHQASAAVCSQDGPRCERSDYTLDTCDKVSLVCGCVAGYSPIPTGCARLSTPSVILEPGRINQFMPGATVKLTCSTDESGNLTFVWRKDGQTLPNQNGKELSIQGADANKLGKFSCMVNDTAVNITSDESYQQEIIPLNVTIVKPRVSGITEAALGVQLDVRCEDIPYGATYQFKMGQSGSLVDSVKQNVTERYVTCVLANVTGVTWGQSESGPISLYPDATDIIAVNIDPGSDMIVRAGSSVTFTCQTTPEEKFLQTATSHITYKFQDNGTASARAVGNTYILTSAAGVTTVRTVSCTAKYGNNLEQTSAAITVTFSDTIIRTPILMASQTEVQSGGLLVLECLGEPSVTYAWLKDGKTIPHQNDHIIQYGNFQPSDAGTFVCTTSRQTGRQLIYTTSSKEVVVRSNAPELRQLASTVTFLVAVICWNLL